jgi:hypothetical protein
VSKMIAGALPFLWCFVAAAAEVHDAPIPETMNWGAIIIFAVIFFGLSGGFLFMVWRNEKKKKQSSPEA